jgi:exosortase
MVRTNLLFAVICVLALLLFWMPLTTLCRLSQQQDMCSLALLILPMGLGLVYVERKKIFFDVSYCFGVGMGLVLAGIVLRWLDEKHLQHLGQNDCLSLAVFSAVVVLMGGFVLCYGSKAFRAALFPLLLLLLMVPIPGFLLERIVAALQRGSAEVTDVLFRLSGVPVFRQGFNFSLAGVTIEIAQECSGIRSTMALFITSLLAGHVFLRSTWRRVFLSVFAIAMGIVKNGVRIVTLSLLGVYVDSRFLTGRIHHQYGGTLFTPLALAVLVPVLWLLQKSENNVQNSGPRGEHPPKGRFVPEME